MELVAYGIIVGRIDPIDWRVHSTVSEVATCGGSEVVSVRVERACNRTLWGLPLLAGDFAGTTKTFLDERQRTALEGLSLPATHRAEKCLSRHLAAGNSAGNFRRLIHKPLNRLNNSPELGSLPGTIFPLVINLLWLF